MLTCAQALDRLDTMLAAAREAGADAADAVYAGDASTSIAVRLGALEDVGRSEGEEMGLRVFIGQRAANVVTSDLSPGALREAAERAVAMARLRRRTAMPGWPIRRCCCARRPSTLTWKTGASWRPNG